MNIEGIFSIADIMNYDYCPRIPYFEYILNDPQRKTSKTKRGLQTHEDFSIKAKRAKIVTEFPKLEKKFNVKLLSKNTISKHSLIVFYSTAMKHIRRNLNIAVAPEIFCIVHKNIS